ncbi:MAG: histidine triad nucleotide-binding protein [Armatimonadetes bacterium]|nr:histidine triad nucleotide-binding protein [Armatimonadota bacterium]
MTDCLFCRIAQGEVPSSKVYEDELTYAFGDIHPQAPVHVLLVPRKHIATHLDVASGDLGLLGHMHDVVNRLARDLGVAEQGFRIVLNCKEWAGQSVDHLHFHLLGGRRMSWPPG